MAINSRNLILGCLIWGLWISGSNAHAVVDNSSKRDSAVSLKGNFEDTSSNQSISLISGKFEKAKVPAIVKVIQNGKCIKGSPNSTKNSVTYKCIFVAGKYLWKAISKPMAQKSPEPIPNTFNPIFQLGYDGNHTIQLYLDKINFKPTFESGILEYFLVVARSDTSLSLPKNQLQGGFVKVPLPIFLPLKSFIIDFGSDTMTKTWAVKMGAVTTKETLYSDWAFIQIENGTPSEPSLSALYSMANEDQRVRVIFPDFIGVNLVDGLKIWQELGFREWSTIKITPSATCKVPSTQSVIFSQPNFSRSSLTLPIGLPASYPEIMYVDFEVSC